jgi:magnesium transporter
VVVVDGDQLCGVVTLIDLLGAPDEALLGSLMVSDRIVASVGNDPEAIVVRAARHGHTAVAVTDENGRFVGAVSSGTLIARLVHEHDEDLARLGGYITRGDQARHAAEEPLRERLLHRLPWLLAGLGGAMLSAVLVGAFETDLERNVLLAIFIPAIVYMADAIGTQTEALVIRGMAADFDWRTVVWRELATGVLVGLAIAALFLPFAWVLWGDLQVAVTVALSLLAAAATATAVAMGLPWAIARSGRDPAFGSGPIATVVQDLLTIAIYFAVASVLVS